MNKRVRTAKLTRPLVGGISAAHRFSSSGTLACLCRVRSGADAGAIVALSNNHVFARRNLAAPGDPLYQPALGDAGRYDGHFADLLRFVPIEFGVQSANAVDAAIGKLRIGIEYEASVKSVGELSGATAAQVGMRVCKMGRSTGYTEGIVTELDAEHTVRLSTTVATKQARFVNQIRIEPTSPHSVFAQEGDSGSLIVEKETRAAVGLFFAGGRSRTYALANPIQAVLESLDIEILTA